MKTRAFGLLVGGQGSRLGGVPKGLLPVDNQVSLLDRLLDQCRLVDAEAPIYLLGNRTEYIDYESQGLVRLPDNPPGVGPLGGLHAVLELAERRGYQEVILIGCDLPYLTAGLIRRIAGPQLQTAIAASSGTPPHWEPMLSRYDVQATLPTVREQLKANALGLFALLQRLNATALALTPDEATELVDWDTPEDVLELGPDRPSRLALPANTPD